MNQVASSGDVNINKDDIFQLIQAHQVFLALLFRLLWKHYKL